MLLSRRIFTQKLIGLHAEIPDAAASEVVGIGECSR